MLLVLISALVLVPQWQLVARAMHQDPGDTDGTLQLSEAEQQPAASEQPRAAVCIRNSGRPCKHWREGTIVDTVMQCRHKSSMSFMPSAVNVSSQRATCSLDQQTNSGEEGVCMCSPGYCADADLQCLPQEYKMLPDIFTITTKVSLQQEKLYMDADGTVKLGTPADPRAGQWRISETKQGVKLLSTEMYFQTVLQEYESCTSKTDEMTSLTWSSCELVVGHVQEPRADEMGWFISPADESAYRHIQDQLNMPDADLTGQLISDFQDFFVNLRSAQTGDVLFVSPVSKIAQACQSTSNSCPGDHGALRFDPPLIGRADFQLDKTGTGLPQGIRIFFITSCVFVILVLFLGFIHLGGRMSLGKF